MVKNGLAIDITTAGDRNAIPENYEKIGVLRGVYGLNGMLLKGLETGKLYAITARSTAIFVF